MILKRMLAVGLTVALLAYALVTISVMGAMLECSALGPRCPEHVEMLPLRRDALLWRLYD